MSDQTKMRRVVIKASEWQRGSQKPGGTKLLNREGYRCCLGIDARACGVPDHVIRDRGMPSAISPDHQRKMADGTYVQAWINRDGAAAGATGVNDALSLTDKQRIERLRPIFRKAGAIIVWRPDL